MILDDIVAKKRMDLAEEERLVPLSVLEKRALSAPHVRDFYAALLKRGLAVIAEVKRASPSKGMIAKEFDPAAAARRYEAGGAAAVSVLTERHFFRGSDEHLSDIKSATALPVLKKDFLIAERQVVGARAIGADAVLLIAAILDDKTMTRLSSLAGELGMRCLFEAHDETEVRRIADCGAKIVGVNNRDLHTFEVSLETFERLRPLIPSGVLAVAESGIRTRRDALRMEKAGANAVLVGESLMKAGDSAALIRELGGVGHD
jgi:indole-3-glycerol phosphate synthase